MSSSRLPPKSVLAARPVTRVKSKPNPSLGSAESDQERKKQPPMKLQEFASMFQQEELDFSVLDQGVQNIRMDQQEFIYL